MNRTVFWATSLALAFGGAMSAQATEAAGAAAPSGTGSWTGFYVGLNAGVGGDRVEHPFSLFDGNTGTAAAKISAHSGGLLGGVQTGFNWQFDSRLVFGVEADLASGPIDGTYSFTLNSTNSNTNGSAAFSIRSRLDYLGTVRGRIGYSPSDPLLVYLTGGWAYAGGATGLYTMRFGSAQQPQSFSGWTAGVGTEIKLDPRWSIKADYLYVDLGAATLVPQDGILSSPIETRPYLQVMRLGANYRFGAGSAAQPASATAGGPQDWTGFHAGLHSGYASGRIDHGYNVDLGMIDPGIDGAINGTIGTTASGYLAGGHFDYNFRLGQRGLIGFEADLDWAKIEGGFDIKADFADNGANAGTLSAGLGSKLFAFGTARGKLGYAVTDPWLVYGTAGFAYAVSWSHADATVAFSGATGDEHPEVYTPSFGWTVGFGTEYALSRKLSFKADYLHADFGTTELAANNDNGYRASLDIHPVIDMVRTGFSYRIDSWSPVAAP